MNSEILKLPLKFFKLLIDRLLQVKNFISLGGPHAGTASVPLCGVYISFFLMINRKKVVYCIAQTLFFLRVTHAFSEFN